jgi:uncharacterized protein (TIGR03083 family)
MTTPSYAELVTAVRREGEGIAAAAGMGTDAAVATCGDWTVESLVVHVSRVCARVAKIITTRATEQPQTTVELPDGDPLEVFRDVLDELVTSLSECEADTPLWNWEPSAPQTAMFWARRMAHESSMHRFDAQAAHGVLQPIDSELAGDGVDELVDVLARRVYTRDQVSGPTGTVTLQASDHDAWHLQLEPDGIRRTEIVTAPDAAVSGTSSALLLAVCGRIPWTSLEVTGDSDLLGQWSAAMKF